MLWQRLANTRYMQLTMRHQPQCCRRLASCSAEQAQPVIQGSWMHAGLVVVRQRLYIRSQECLAAYTVCTLSERSSRASCSSELICSSSWVILAMSSSSASPAAPHPAFSSRFWMTFTHGAGPWQPTHCSCTSWLSCHHRTQGSMESLCITSSMPHMHPCTSAISRHCQAARHEAETSAHACVSAGRSIEALSRHAGLAHVHEVLW